jgi:peptidoglycan/xylan/chitin deacetylase (PgdA/CDA1 family)
MQLIQTVIAQVRRAFTSRAMILMYHRIADVDTDPWGLSVSPVHFSEQLQVIRRYFYPLSMQQLMAHLRDGNVPRRSVVVTFDDGYLDNLTNARPLLAQHDVPATIFLVTQAVAEGRKFWWDRLAAILLQPEVLPDHLDLKMNGRRHEWTLGRARWYSREEREKDRLLRPWDAASGTRLAFFYLVWKYLLELSNRERIQTLEVLQEWAGVVDDPHSPDRALNQDETIALLDEDLIELGAHTVTHPSLSLLPGPQQMEEIAGSKKQLEEIINREVTSFSYPHGEYSVETRDLVRRVGLDSACTTNHACVSRDADPLQLPRFQVDDWNGEEFLRRLVRWYALS